MPRRKPPLGERIAARAEGYLDTPYWMGGRTPGTGEGCFLDCAGVVVLALRGEGVECGDPAYVADGMSDTLPPIEEALRGLTRLEPDVARQPGDVLCFRYPKAEGHLYGVCHLGIVSRHADMVVNAPGLRKPVKESMLSGSMERSLVAVWRAEEPG